jgi:hypothetical protein
VANFRRFTARLSTWHFRHAQGVPGKLPADFNSSQSKSKRPAPEEKTYNAATIKSIQKNKIVLDLDGQEVTVVSSAFMKSFDAKGKQLKGKENQRVLKEGNQVDVVQLPSPAVLAGNSPEFPYNA